MNSVKALRNSIAGILIAVMPLSATSAAVRPNAAVPTAATASTAQARVDAPYFGSVAWAAIGIIAITLLVGIWISVDKDKDGQGAFSRG